MDTLYTLGHSNRSSEGFVELARLAGLRLLVDVRRFPRSRRHPWFDSAPLAAALAAVGVGYEHLEALGGHRGEPPARLERYVAALQDPWRGYAAHMRSDGFASALARLLALGRERGPANPVGSFTPRAYDTRSYRVPERVGQYGFSVQQQLPGNTVLTVGYVGSQGRNLFQRSVTNTIRNGVAVIGPTDPLPTNAGIVNRCAVALVNGTCPGNITGTTTIRQFDVVGSAFTGGVIVANPNSRLTPFGEIDYKTSGGRDSYNALQITINRRFTQGLTLGGQYQWAHSIGTSQGSNDANTTQDPFNFNNERGNNTFDIRNSANLTALYELPIGTGKAINLEGVANTLLGGWQVGGVFNGRSGTPLNIGITRADLAIQCVQTGGCPNGSGGLIAVGTTGRFTAPSATAPLPIGFIAVINTPGGNASRNTRRPDLVSGVNPYANNGSLTFLNPGAFAIPRAGTYGNLSRNALSGPSFYQFDLTMQKRFKLTEKTNVEFRTEVYNLLNRANFANPSVSLSENLPAITFNPTTGITTVGSGLQPGQSFTTALQPNFSLINATVGRTVGLGTNRQIQFSLRLNF